MKWPVPIDWRSPAGELITELGTKIPPERRTPIILFGSAALQMTVAPTLLSADADISPDIVPCDPRQAGFPNAYDREELTRVVRTHGLGIDQRPLYIQVNAPGAFQPGTGYLRRIMETTCGNLHITIPHPLDILIAKLHRFEPKDFEAFQKVYGNTGFPTPEILLAELRLSPRLFAKQEFSHGAMPSQFPESKINESVPKLFRDLWGKSISVKKDILEPVQQELGKNFADHEPGHKRALTEIAETPLNNEDF